MDNQIKKSNKKMVKKEKRRWCCVDQASIPCTHMSKYSASMYWCVCHSCLGCLLPVKHIPWNKVHLLLLIKNACGKLHKKIFGSRKSKKVSNSEGQQNRKLQLIMIHQLINLLSIVTKQRTNLILKNIRVAKLSRWKHELRKCIKAWEITQFLQKWLKCHLLIQ